MHKIIAPPDPTTSLVVRFIIWLLTRRKKKEN